MDTTNRKPDTRFNARGPFPEGTDFWQSESDALFVIIRNAGLFRSYSGKLYLVPNERRGRLISNFAHAGLQINYDKYMEILTAQLENPID